MKNRSIRFAVDVIENRIIRQKAASKGLRLSEFIRGLCMSYDISYKYTQSDRVAYLTLVKFSDQFRVISLKLEEARYDEAAMLATSLSHEIRKHLIENF